MQLISTHPIKKSDLGFHANLFGGKLLAWLDAAGAAYAMEVADTPRMVTIKIDECVFKRPAKEGQLIKIYGSVESLWTPPPPPSFETQAPHVSSCSPNFLFSPKIKFVRIDENNDPIPISQRVKDKYATNN
jgi:acyl-CoA thioesterase YciA